MEVGDIVRFRLGRHDTVGRVVRKPDGMDRMQIEVMHVGVRTTFTNHTRHIDDVVLIKRGNR